MINRAKPTENKGNVLQFPSMIIPKAGARSHIVSERFRQTSVSDDLIASNDRVAQILNRLCDVCDSLLTMPKADHDLVSNHLAAALENTARMARLLDESDDSF